MEFPYPGISTWKNSFGMQILRLHYEADPDKGLGEKVHVEQIKKDLSPWAKAQYDGMTDKNLFRQEYEVDFAATLGQLLYQLQAECTIEKRFPIPASWTRYYALDPHPAVPHMSLWCAVDPYGDRWYYREYWPSKAYGLAGKVPEDDNRIRIRDYVEVVKWLESEENPENTENGKPFTEEIQKRVIDYAARAFGKGTSDDPDSPNFQKRFEDAGDELEIDMRFEDAKKDRDVGVEMVNEGLKPYEVLGPDGTYIKRSRIHIFEDLHELIYELRNVRYQQLTAVQAEKMDPTGKPVSVRCHAGDCLRYTEMANPEYVEKRKIRSTWRPVVDGIAR